MKTWIYALPLLCVVNLAPAADMGSARDADQRQSAAASAKPAGHHRMHKRTIRKFRSVKLPRGDLRYCLDRKTNKAIIRCSEKRRKR